MPVHAAGYLMQECLPEDVRYGGFADRTAAFVMDGIIVSTLFFYLLEGIVAIGSFFGPLFFAGTAEAFDIPEMPIVLGSIIAGVVIFILLCWLYSAGVTSSQFGATFGKMIMGLAVTDHAGNRLTFAHATVRFIAKVFSGLVLLIGFFMIHFSEKKEGLHDRFAATYVVYRKTVARDAADAGTAAAGLPRGVEPAREEQDRSGVKKGLLVAVGLPTLLMAVIPCLTGALFSRYMKLLP